MFLWRHDINIFSLGLAQDNSSSTHEILSVGFLAKRSHYTRFQVTTGFLEFENRPFWFHLPNRFVNRFVNDSRENETCVSMENTIRNF
jgi:hypothetical protein